MATKKPWHPLDLEALPNCRFLACDPSLLASGLVFIEVHEGQVYIVEAEKVGTVQTDEGGWESNFARAGEIGDLFTDLLDKWYFDWGQMTAVYEAPPAGGGNVMRPESSIMAGMAFRNACHYNGLSMDKLVTPQSHKKLICGNYIAKKKEHHDAIRELLPRIHDSKRISNEPLRDALSIGLYAAHRFGELNGSSS